MNEDTNSHNYVKWKKKTTTVDHRKEDMRKTGQNLAFWATSAASKNGANAHANHIIFFYLNIKYVPTYFFINIWVGYLNNTKCIDKGFLVL